MKLKMIETKKGSPDGLKVNTYEKGEIYNIPDELAGVFLNQLKVAVLYADPEEIETPERPKNIETPEKKKQKKKTVKKKKS